MNYFFIFLIGMLLWSIINVGLSGYVLKNTDQYEYVTGKNLYMMYSVLTSNIILLLLSLYGFKLNVSLPFVILFFISCLCLTATFISTSSINIVYLKASVVLNSTITITLMTLLFLIYNKKIN